MTKCAHEAQHVAGSHLQALPPPLASHFNSHTCVSFQLPYLRLISTPPLVSRFNSLSPSLGMWIKATQAGIAMG
eukprot:361415-Chlamydomonas_euryale.AAC.9